MDAKEVHRLTDEEIDVEIDRMQRKLFDLRSQAVTEKIENPSLFKTTRRGIARLKTEKHMRAMKKQGAAS